MLLRFKFTLLTVFVLLTLVGLAVPDMTLIGLGVMALGLSMAAAIIEFTLRDVRQGPETQFSP